MKKSISQLKILSFCLALVLAACSLPVNSNEERIALGVAQTSIALTQAALDAGSGNQPPPVAEAPQAAESVPTPTLTQTLTPTVTLTPTLSAPMVTVSRSTYCRTGPGEPYEIVSTLLENQEAEVLGVSPDGGTWIIRNPDGSGECWLWGYYATVTGPTEGLPVRTPPPTPTPAFDWSGYWDGYMGPIEDDMVIPSGMTFTVDGSSVTILLHESVEPVDMTGTISSDGLSISGTWTDPWDDGVFTFYALGTDQFQGRGNEGDGEFKWCGSRGGAGMPDPCYKP